MTLLEQFVDIKLMSLYPCEWHSYIVGSAILCSLISDYSKQRLLDIVVCLQLRIYETNQIIR